MHYNYTFFSFYQSQINVHKRMKVFHANIMKKLLAKSNKEKFQFL